MHELDLLSRRNCLVIAEIAQTHDGSLGTAHSYIDSIARAGAHAVKFQTHIASAESTLDEPWRVKFSRQDVSRYDYWKRMEFSEEQWAGLKQHADELGLIFLSSPFSIEAADLLSRIGVCAWKVASGEVTNFQLLDHMIATKLPIFLSTGMSPVDEVDLLVERVQTSGNQFAVLQCTSMYPVAPEKLGLNMIKYFRERYNCPVGLSDHSGNIYAGLAAVSLGASILEVHVTFSREAFGPDIASSITTSELKQLVDGIHFIETALSAPVNKEALAAELQPMRGLFTKSIVARDNLSAGALIVEEMLALKKPGNGLPPDRLTSLIGRRLRHAIAKDQQIKEYDLE